MENKQQQFRIAEIEVSRSTMNDKIVGFFRYESANKGKSAPVLLVIAEIHSTLYVYERLLDAINQAADQTRNLMSGMELDPLSRFEKLVQRLNETLAEFNQAEDSSINWKRVNVFLLELTEKQICLSGTGHIANMFLQKQGDGTFRAFDLFGSLEQPEEPDPAKPFSSLICGDMNIGDQLFVGSTNFERLRNELKLKERLTSLPPVSAAMEIKQELEQRGIPDDFIGAIIASTERKVQAPAAAPVEKPTSTSSVQKLRENEKDVSEHLTPALAPVKEIQKTGEMVEKVTSAVKEKLGSMFGKNGGYSPASTQAPIKDPVALAGLRGMNAGYGTVFTPQRKLMAAGAGVLILGSLIGGFFWKQSQKRASEIAAWNAAYDIVIDSRNSAESDLVYGNEAKARTEIAKAEQNLTSLPADTEERKTKVEKAKKDIEDIRERLKRVVKADSAAELVALAPTAAEGSLAAPVLTADAAYAVDNDSGNILKIDLTTKEIKKIQLPSKESPVVAGSQNKDTVTFATKSGSIFSLTKTTDLVKTTRSGSAKSSSTQDIAFYQGRIYGLDPANSQVWRSAANGSFGSEAAYIKASSAPLNDATAIAIDSSVYVLKTDGTLLQFLSGAQEGFSLATVDPPVRAASGLWTDLDVPALLVTDPADKRVLVYEKSGQLRAQITSTQFFAPKDVAGEYTNKRMAVVDGNRLLLVAIP